MRQASLDFLKRIADAPSPSGYEQPAARVYRDYVGPFADAVTTDVHGNVAAVVNPAASMRIMLAGHMDELGFIITTSTTRGSCTSAPSAATTARWRSASACGSTASAASPA